MYADPEVVRHAGSSTPRTREESERELRELTSHWEVHGFGSWAVTDRETGDFIGVIEIKYAGAGVEGIEPDEVEIGWTLLHASWGRGLATEAARAAAHHVFERLDVPWLVAYVRPANIPSLRVAEKLGMRDEGEGRAHNGDTVRIFRLPRGGLAAPTVRGSRSWAS